MNIKTTIFGAIGWFTLALAAPAHSTQVLYGVDFGVPSNFITIDPSTAGTSLVGQTAQGITRLAYNTATGTLFSVSYFGGSSYSLSTLNPATGAATNVGALAPELPSLAFSADGSKLYGLDFGHANIALYEINQTTAASTFIAATPFYFGGALAINSANQAFITNAYVPDWMYRIDLTTGALTGTGILSEGVESLAFDENDVLYGVTVNSDHLVRINTTTAAMTTVGQLPYADVGGIAFAFERTAFVPAPGGAALFAMAVAALVRRRATSRP